MHCQETPLTCFSIIKAASSHSQLAGILAAFAFGAIVFLLQKHDDSRDIQRPLISFFLAFFGCSISTFLFSTLSGIQLGPESPRILVLEYSISFIFSVSIVPLFYGIVTLFGIYEWKESFNIGKIIFILALLVELLFMLVTALDVAQTVDYRGLFENRDLWIAFSGLVLFISIGFAASWAMQYLWKDRFFTALTYTLLSLIVFFTFVISYMFSAPVGSKAEIFWSPIFTMGVMGLFSMSLGLYLWLLIHEGKAKKDA